MIQCLHLSLKASRSFFSTTTVSISNLRFLRQSSRSPSYYAHLILTSHSYTPNRSWSPRRFRLLLTNPNLLTKVLNTIRDSPEIAFHFFKWAQSQRRVKHSLPPFAAMLEILAEKEGLVSKAYWVAERSIDLGMHGINDLLIDGGFDKRVACKALDLLLWVYTKKDMVEECVLSFEKMIRMIVEHGIVPNVVTVNTMLDSCFKGGDLQQVLEMEMERDVMPNVITFNTLLDSCFKAGDLQGVTRVLSEMERRGVGASEVTYNILINGFSKNGKMEEAMRFHGDMRRFGFLSELIRLIR